MGPTRCACLYRWNCQVSTTLFELLGWFEIAWRNTVDTAICARRPDAPHWLLDPEFPLRSAARQKVQRAVAAVRRRGTAAPLPGQIIAELPLGFWRFPTMRGYRTTVWAPYLSRAFPHAGHRPLQEDVDRRPQPIILMRNRVAHHEPVFARPDQLRGLVEDVVELGFVVQPERGPLVGQALVGRSGARSRTRRLSTSHGDGVGASRVARLPAWQGPTRLLVSKSPTLL